MTATVVLNAQGQPVSVGTVIASPLPTGCTTVAITDADFTAICAGDKRIGTNGALTDTNRATLAANVATLQTRAQAYLALPSPTALQTTKAVRALVHVFLNLLDDITDTA